MKTEPAADDLRPLDLWSLCQAMAERAPLPMATVEGSGHIVRYVNPAFCRLMDEPTEHLVGRPFAEMLPDRDDCVSLLARVYRTGQAESHIEQEHSDSHPVFWSYAAWPVVTDDRSVGVMLQVMESTQLHETTLAMNEALVLGSLRQHELTEAAETLNIQLQEEIAERGRAEAALRENEERYRSLFSSIDEGFCVLEKVDGAAGKSADFRYIEANPAFVAQSGISGMIGKTIRQVLPSEAEGWCSIYDAVVQTGEPKKFERGLLTQGRILELYAFRVEDKTHRRVAVIFKDVTKNKHAEAAVRQSEERFRTLFELGPVAVYSCDASGVIQEFNRRAAELWGRAPALGDTDERFCGSFKMLRPDGGVIPHEQRPMAEVLSGRISEVRDAEVLIERPDGSRATVLVNIRPLKNQHGDVTGAINCFFDISERKKDEQHRLLLTDELAHRGKNLLSVILAIVSRSLSGTRPLAEEREVLIQRLHAVARSQSLLISEGFEGAPLTEIVRLEFESFSDRVKAAGPDVMLSPKVAQTFALLVHELATNAIKYGALTRPDGQIAVHWSVEGVGEKARFRFHWQEMGGSPVVPPTRQGFGRILLERAVAHEFGVVPKVRFAPEGLIYEIDAPLSAVAAPV